MALKFVVCPFLMENQGIFLCSHHISEILFSKLFALACFAVHLWVTGHKASQTSVLGNTFAFGWFACFFSAAQKFHNNNNNKWFSYSPFLVWDTTQSALKCIITTGHWIQYQSCTYSAHRLHLHLGDLHVVSFQQLKSFIIIIIMVLILSPFLVWDTTQSALQCIITTGHWIKYQSCTYSAHS